MSKAVSKRESTQFFLQKNTESNQKLERRKMSHALLPAVSTLNLKSNREEPLKTTRVKGKTMSVPEWR
jgi:hypothetical protein